MDLDKCNQEESDNMKLEMIYLGCTSIHSYYTEPMLPWLVFEVLAHNECTPVLITDDNSELIVTSLNTNISPFSQIKRKRLTYDSSSSSSNEIENQSSSDLISFEDSDRASIASDKSDITSILHSDLESVKDVFEVFYLKKQYLMVFTQENPKLPSYCYIFTTSDKIIFRNSLKYFYSIISKNKHKNIDTADNIVHTEDLDSIRFEVMLLGKINVKTLHQSNCFIDESVKRIEQHHLHHHHEHKHQHEHNESLNQSTGTSSNNSLATQSFSDVTPLAPTESSSIKNAKADSFEELPSRQRCQSLSHSTIPSVRRRQRHVSEPSVANTVSNRSKIRILLIGKTSLKLICPANTFKTVDIKFSAISKCMQGKNLKDHFGFIASDVKTTGTSSHGGRTKSASEPVTETVRQICYVFKCAEEYICEEIMQGLKQAFMSMDSDLSPMNDYHTLCSALANSKGNNHSIFEKIKLANLTVTALNENEKECVHAQLSEMQPKTNEEKLGAIMTTLRHAYEVRHVQHKSHLSASSANALSQYESPLFFTKKIDHLKSKAKHSFENFWQKSRKKMQELQQDAGHFTEQFSDMSLTNGNKLNVMKINNHLSHSAPVTPNKEHKKKITKKFEDLKSSMEVEAKEDIPVMLSMMPFFHRMYGTINNNASLNIDENLNLPPPVNIQRSRSSKEFSVQDIQKAWKWAFSQQLLLNKIRKIELQDPQSPPPNFKPSLKTKYPSLVPVPSCMQDIWEEIINLPCEIKGQNEMNIQVLQAAIEKGIDCVQRGRVWKFLQEQWQHRSEIKSEGHMNAFSYAALLQNLTTYQHAILIDIGRTFPGHPFYNQQLGAGQLALFNLLKAYSLTDKEVGYCQGLSFVTGILLMHTCIEWEAFELLHHLMYDIGCRSMYMPDMKGIRLAVYKLSRVLYDAQRDLYEFFEKNEVSILLIATPWFLTMFASTFSMSFVARVFDMVFVSGTAALFSVAACILMHHKTSIMECKDFEDIVNYIRTEIPNMSSDSMASIISESLKMDLKSKLQTYETEYTLLHKEYPIYMEIQTRHQKLVEELEMIKQVNKTVTESNCDLMQQLHNAQHKNAMLQKQINHESIQNK